MTQTESPVLSLRSIHHSYSSTIAVADLDLNIYAGKVHALIGENGAGKSTAAQIASGVIRQSSGDILLNGEIVSFDSARSAERFGVVLIPQELRLFGPLTIAENLFAGRKRPRKSFGLVDRQAMLEKAREVLTRLDSDLKPSLRVEDLSPASRQIVAIARALMIDAKVMIMDEPTAALDEWEAQRLLKVITRLANDDVAVLYVSHRLHEVTQIADEITVMRDGKKVANGPTKNFTIDSLVEMMVGRAITLLSRPKNNSLGEVALASHELSQKGTFSNISLSVRTGEVVGLAGIVGSGRSEFAQAMFGYLKPSSGRISINGKEFSPKSVAKVIQAGLGYVPEERQTQGLFDSLSVLDNVAITSLSRFKSLGFIAKKKLTSSVIEELRPLRIRGEITALVSKLSGGNQQKALLARWLMAAPRVLVLDEPTRGIDVGTRSEIYDLVAKLTEQGIAILLISSDLQELLLLSDRILVMRRGAIVGEFSGKEMTELNVGSAALGRDKARA